jgi:hypothetical protein
LETELTECMAEAEQTIAGFNWVRRKVRTPQGRVLHNVESWQREGKCNRKYTARLFGFSRRLRKAKTAG